VLIQFLALLAWSWQGWTSAADTIISQTSAECQASALTVSVLDRLHVAALHSQRTVQSVL